MLVTLIAHHSNPFFLANFKFQKVMPLKIKETLLVKVLPLVYQTFQSEQI